MTKQPDSIDAKEEMKMAASTTGAADSFPRFDKFQLLVGEPSSVEYSYVSNCLDFQTSELHNVNVFTQTQIWVQHLPQKRVNLDLFVFATKCVKSWFVCS